MDKLLSILEENSLFRSLFPQGEYQSPKRLRNTIFLLILLLLLPLGIYLALNTQIFRPKAAQDDMVRLYKFNNNCSDDGQISPSNAQVPDEGVCIEIAEIKWQ